MKTATLDELCEIKVGRTPARAEPSFWGSGHRWLSIADMNQGLTITETKEQITDAGVKAGKLVEPGTVLLSFKLSIGKVGIAAVPLYTNEAIAALPVRDENKLDARYLMRALEAMELADGSNRAAMGATLNKKSLAQIRVPLPSLHDQRRIAGILDHADALRARRREVDALLDGLGPAIFRHMFGDPVTNERRWPVKRLADLGTLDRGVSKHRPRNDRALLGGAHPLIQTGDVANSGGYIRNFHSTYSDLGLAQSRMWPAGTLCITIAANIAKTGILTFDACFPDSVVGFTSDPETITFVQAWLGFLQATLEASAPQSAQKNINLAILRELEVPIPDGDLLKAFDKRVSALKEHRARTNRGQAELDAVFASLQSRALRGEL